MKVRIILFSTFLIISCSQFESESSNSLKTPTDLQLAEKQSNQNSSFKVIFENNRIKEIERQKLQLKKEIAELSKNGRLADLEKAKISKDDLEVRLRKQSAWSKT